jgi:hypothetical protein
MLTRVWNEMDYRIDVCRITKSGHIEHLWNMQKKTWRVSFYIGVRITIIRCVVYLLRIFKMFRGLMNNPVYKPTQIIKLSHLQKKHNQKQQAQPQRTYISCVTVSKRTETFWFLYNHCVTCCGCLRINNMFEILRLHHLRAQANVRVAFVTEWDSIIIICNLLFL